MTAVFIRRCVSWLTKSRGFSHGGFREKGNTTHPGGTFTDLESTLTDDEVSKVDDVFSSGDDVETMFLETLSVVGPPNVEIASVKRI